MHVSAATVIKATPEQIWAFITDPGNGPRWQESAISSRVTTPGPVRLGSEMAHIGKWLWVRLKTTAVVTIYERPVRYGYDITTKLVAEPSRMRYDLEPVVEGTGLTLSNDAPLSPWLKPFEPWLRRNVQGMFERDVSRLKAAIEAELAAAAPAPAAGAGAGQPRPA